MSLKILFAEDDKLVTLPFEALFKARGLNLDIVYNGKDAYKKLMSTQYDLLITDYMMPGFTGIELAQEMYKKPNLREIPIIFYSGALDRMPKELKEMNIIHICDKIESALNIVRKIDEYFSVSKKALK